jgi:hypothetical protein
LSSQQTCAAAASTWFVACGSKVFCVLLLPIFRPQGEKSATDRNDNFRSAEGNSQFSILFDNLRLWPYTCAAQTTEMRQVRQPPGCAAHNGGRPV